VNVQAQANFNPASSVNGEYWPLHRYTGSPAVESFWYNGPYWSPSPPINAGVQMQIEVLYIPNTAFTTQTSQYPPANCTSPSQQGCGNGTLKVWQNGTLVLDAENANLNSNQLSAMTNGATAVIGGLITSFKSDGSGTRCTTWSSTGGGTCPGTQPGTGAPKPYYRYLDDIIVLKQ